MVLPAGTRRMVIGERSLYVPLWTADPEGDWHQGRFRISTRLANAKPHTNELHELERVIRERLSRWIAWKARRGWFLNGKVHYVGVSEPPTETARDEVPTDERHVIVSARFTRERPIRIKLSEFDARQQDALRYGVPLEHPAAAPLPPQPHIRPDEPPVDPLVQAESRRTRLGLRRRLVWDGDTMIRGEIEPAGDGLQGLPREDYDLNG